MRMEEGGIEKEKEGVTCGVAEGKGADEVEEREVVGAGEKEKGLR